MAEPGWLRHAIVVGCFEFRRTVRAVRGDLARFAFLLLGVTVPTLVVAGLLVVAVGSLSEIGLVPLPAALRGTIVLFWAFTVFIVTQRTVSIRPRIAGASVILTIVSTRTAALGLAIAESLRVLAYLAPPLLVLAVGLAVGLGTPWPLLALPLAAVGFAGSAVVVASALGYAIAWLVAISPFVARHKTVLGAMAVFVVMGSYLVVQLPSVTAMGVETIAWLPPGWLADLAAVGTPLVGSSSRAIGAVLLATVVIGVGLAVIEWETGRYWYVDPVNVEPNRDERRSEEPPHVGTGALSRAIRPIRIPSWLPLPTRRVAEWILLRARRDPRRLTILLMPFFLILSPLVSTGMQSGAPLSTALPAAVVLLPWVVGGAVSLNALGDEGSFLPITLTAISGPSYVRGLVTPGVLFGTPFAVVFVGLLAAFVGLRPSLTIALVAVTAFLSLGSSILAPAIAMTVPRFSAVRIGQSREVRPPRLTAVAVHFGLIVLPGAILTAVILAPAETRMALVGLLGTFPRLVFTALLGPDAGLTGGFDGLGRAIASTALFQLQLELGIGLGILGLLVMIGAYRYAIRTFDTYEPP